MVHRVAVRWRLGGSFGGRIITFRQRKLDKRPFLTCPPSVRQYDILSNRWGDFICQTENDSPQKTCKPWFGKASETSTDAEITSPPLIRCTFSACQRCCSESGSMSRTRLPCSACHALPPFLLCFQPAGVEYAVEI